MPEIAELQRRVLICIGEITLRQVTTTKKETREQEEIEHTR
jgi:hypothetical protein